MNMPSNPQKFIKFCPFCGGNLEQVNTGTFKFCPFCGETLTVPAATSFEAEIPAAVSSDIVLSEDPIDYSPYEKIHSVEDVIINYERFIQDQKQSGLTDQQLRPLAAELMKRLKAKIPSKSKAPAMPSRTLAAPSAPLPAAYENEKTDLSRFCTIVLKSCHRRENLARRLGTVLLRGYFAIRMAIDTMPCILVYKGKVSDLPSLLPIFREEGAVISLIGGDFEPHINISQLFYPLTLSESTATLLKKFPSQLWLGEKPLFATAVQALERDGLLVITHHHLYFLYLSGNTPEWFILPHQTGHILESSVQAGEYLLLIQTENSQETETLLKISFSHKEELQHAISTIENIPGKDFLFSLHCHCPHCNLSQPIRDSDIRTEKNCPQCQRTMEQKIFQG